MSKAVKLSMIGFGILLAVVTLAIIVFASTFDLNDYKERISRAVKDETGRTLIFDGDLKLEYLPRLGVALGGVSLSNAAGFSPEAMVRADAAHVSVKLIPLLMGKVRFGLLELDGLTLNLSRRKNGSTNWDDLVGRTPEEPTTKSDGDSSFSLNIEGVIMKNSTLAWDDLLVGTQYKLCGLNLKTGQIYKGAPFPVQVDSNFTCTNPKIEGKMTLSGKSSLDFDNREYGHMDMHFSAEAKGVDVPGGKLKAEASFQFLALDFNAEHAQLTGFEASAYGATVHMDGSLDGITKGINKLVATVTVDTFDLRKSLRQMGQNTLDSMDDKALAKVSATTELEFVPGDLHLKSITGELDGCQVTGRAQVKKEAGDPFIFARLDLGELNLDRYLPKTVAKKTSGKSVKIFNTHMLRRLRLDVEAKASKLRLKGIGFEKVDVAVKGDDGLVRVSPISANLYGGSLSSGATIHATGKAPRLDVIAGLNKVDVGALSKDALGEASYAGILDFNTAFSCEGERLHHLLQTMDGKVSFHLADGVFPGVDLAGMVKKTHANKHAKDGTVEASATDSTRFGSIDGSGVISKGVLNNNDLEVKAPSLRCDGHGAVALATGKLDYLLKVKLVPTGKGQGGKSSDDLYGIMVPIRVAGTLENPRYWVSLSEYVKALGGAVIGTAGSLIGGVTDVLKGVGNVVTGGSLDSEKKDESAPKKKGGLFGLGIF